MPNELNEKEQWVLEYISKLSNQATDILDTDFVEAYQKRFKWSKTMERKIGQLLSGLYQKRYLTRFRIGLGLNWQPGFPKWVYSYEFPKE